MTHHIHTTVSQYSHNVSYVIIALYKSVVELPYISWIPYMNVHISCGSIQFTIIKNVYVQDICDSYFIAIDVVDHDSYFMALKDIKIILCCLEHESYFITL